MNHEDIANYADSNTSYVSVKNIDKVVRFLEESSHVISNGLVTINSKQMPANVMCY